MIENRRDWWLYWCPYVTLQRWQDECERVEERFSLFRPFAEAPFLGFRGIVSRSGSAYHVTVAAEMDMYPKLPPWVFVSPPMAGAREDGKLCLDVPWNPETSTFATVIQAVVAYIDMKAARGGQFTPVDNPALGDGKATCLLARRNGLRRVRSGQSGRSRSCFSN